MQYKCTRNKAESLSAAQAIVQGISENGGLFVPESLPSYSADDLKQLCNKSYTERAAHIVADFLPEFTAEEIRECVESAYSEQKFPGGAAPLHRIAGSNQAFLELWHGPTCAFKDMALQLLPHLLTRSLKKTNCDKTAVILVATSGDTGKAALEGFRDVPDTKILVFYPDKGVSAMQQRQMNTQEGENVAVCAIEGNFDDAQTGVKRIFTNPQIRKELEDNGMLFSSANSINWGRLLPQIVYYFSAYCDAAEQGMLELGQPLNVVVPTGNFGNILAAYYAKKMGLPIGKLICASNSNNVLTEFLSTGVYDRNRKFYTTISPSMDILVSSNLERLLFDLTGCDSDQVASWMNELNTTGRYSVGAELTAVLKDLFFSGCCDDVQTQKTIHEMFQSKNYLCDPHTAVAFDVYEQYVKATGDKSTPTVIVSTASPYKFADSVLEAVAPGQKQEEDDFAKVQQLSSLTSTTAPAPIAQLQEKAIRFQNCCEVAQMPQVVLQMAGLEPKA